MEYIEVIKDLFEVPKDYYLAHCISADFALGKGIAIEFDKRFHVKYLLQSGFLDYVNIYHRGKMNGRCIITNNVINLITKERYFQKPTYESIQNALKEMKEFCRIYNIKKVAMPQIGCGLDKLDWYTVSLLIQGIFKDTDVEILVCKLK